jgi:hypothetical protein
MRDVIYIRRGANGSLERSEAPTADPTQWLPTGLSEDMIIDGPTPKRLNELFDEWSKIENITDIETELDLKTQYSIGRQLCRALGAPAFLKTTDWLHLVPLARSEDETFFDLFCRIPWNMIGRDDTPTPMFLARDPTQLGSITIDASPSANGSARYSDVRMPPYPRVLLVIPSKLNTERRPTRADEHLQQLNDSMIAPYEKQGIRKRIAHVSTFEEFEHLLRDGIDGLAPHIVYFYGHADAFYDTSAFLFDDPNSDAGEWIGIDKIEIALKEGYRKLGNFPPVIWVNACKSASAKRNSFLRALAPLASTVLATRTLATVKDSRALAEVALPLIAINGQAPHSALRMAFRAKMPPVSSSRWATVVVSVQYELWSALETEERQFEDADSAGDFPSRLDRTSSLSKIEVVLKNHLSSFTSGHQSSDLLPLSIGWRGDAEQRIDMFERRVGDLLQERLHKYPAISRRVDLQLDVSPRGGKDLQNHFLRSVLAGVLRERAHVGRWTPDLGHVQRAIKSMVTSDTRAVLLEHGPFTSIHADQISQYADFWREYASDLMPGGYQLALLLAFGFSEEPTHVGGSESEILHTFIQLESVSHFELKSHMEAFYRFYRFPKTRAAKEAEILISSTAGSFRKLQIELEKIANISRWAHEFQNGGMGK